MLQNKCLFWHGAERFFYMHQMMTYLYIFNIHVQKADSIFLIVIKDFKQNVVWNVLYFKEDKDQTLLPSLLSNTNIVFGYIVKHSDTKNPLLNKNTQWVFCNPNESVSLK